MTTTGIAYPSADQKPLSHKGNSALLLAAPAVAGSCAAGLDGLGRRAVRPRNLRERILRRPSYSDATTVHLAQRPGFKSPEENLDSNRMRVRLRVDCE